MKHSYLKRLAPLWLLAVLLLACTQEQNDETPDFSLELSPSAMAIAQNAEAQVTVTISATGGFDGAVALSLEGDMSNLIGDFGPDTKTSRTLTLKAGVDAATGVRTLNVRGVAGSLNKVAELRLTVKGQFGTEELREVISAEDPPAGPVRINEHLTVRFVGKGTLSDEPPEEAVFTDVDTPGSDPLKEVPVEEAEYGQVAFRVFNPTTGNEFELLFEQPLLEAVHAVQEARGLTSATDSVEDPDDNERPIIPQGWANGSDGRNLLSPTMRWPWRAVSQSSMSGEGEFTVDGTTFSRDDSRCTFTLIGPRHLITAAHCINRRGTDTWFTVEVTPGRDGVANSPYGSSTIEPEPDPGTEAWYFTPAPWRSSSCAGGNYKCPEWDWGLIVTPDRLGDLTGWLGYWAGPGSYLNGRTHYNRGYPMCEGSASNRPALCDNDTFGEELYWARLFGDSQPCDLGSYFSPGPDGWNRVIKHSCDTSGGHSGSSVYHYRFNEATEQWVPVVSMVHHSTDCGVCSSGADHPNRARRITPGDLGIISWLRNTFP